MAENQTRVTDASVADYIAAIEDESRRADCRALAKLMQRVTGEKPKMWGPGIVGFGSYHYRYESGREGDSPVAAFASRKDALTIYFPGGGLDDLESLARLGKCKTTKGCLYIKHLSDVDLAVLESMVAGSATEAKAKEACVPCGKGPTGR